MQKTDNRRTRGNSSAPRGKRGPNSYSRAKNTFGGKHGGGKFRGNRASHGNKPRGTGQGRGGRKSTTFNPSQFINTNPVSATPEVYTPTHTFETFGLNERIAAAFVARGITTPTPIQDQVIPEILAGRDVIGLAETGTGKTAAFLAPLVHKVLADKKRQTLILAPTRELALQIERELHTLTKGAGIYATVCVGGVNINPQIRSLRRPNHFIIGTPGRIKDLMARKALSLANISAVVLDEADRMLDMGFIHDMRAILSTTPKERETLFFSATMPSGATQLVNEFLRDPVTVSVKKTDVTNSIAQDVVRYESANKFDTLTELLENSAFDRVLVFGAMKHSVEKLSRDLSKSGIRAESIHGNKSHGQRQRSLAAFKNGQARVLVATDVAARGIHVDNVSHVINYDLPQTFEDYVHRIGRTGRGSNSGKALTFVPARG